MIGTKFGRSVELFFAGSPWTCSNYYFEGLPAGYRALTPYGYYQSPSDKSNVDANNLVLAGQVVELSCASTSNPEQLPLSDAADRNATDGTLSVLCMPPLSGTNPGNNGM